MIKWIFTGCFIIIIAITAGGAGIVNEALGEEGQDSGAGSIYSIGAKSVVINDMSYKFSSNAKFRGQDDSSSSKASFKKGDKVVFILNNKNEIIILQKDN